MRNKNIWLIFVFAMIVIMLTVGCDVPSEPTDPSRTKGPIAADVNNDGEIEVNDLVLIRRYIAGGYGVELI